MAAEVRMGNVGVRFEATVKDEDGTVINVSGADGVAGRVKQFNISKPDGTTDTWTCGFTTDGTDGKIDYTTLAGDLDVADTWYAQPYLVTAALTLNTDVHSFEVKRNL